MADIVDRIADILINDYAELMAENKKLRDENAYLKEKIANIESINAALRGEADQ